MGWPDRNTVVIIVSALAAAASFAAFAIPLLRRQEKKERYRDVIEKKRRALFEQARDQANKPQHIKQGEMSAAKSLALTHRLQKLAGGTILSARGMMLQAGIREPMAPLYYLISRIVAPVIFAMLAAIFATHTEKE